MQNFIGTKRFVFDRSAEGHCSGICGWCFCRTHHADGRRHDQVMIKYFNLCHNIFFFLILKLHFHALPKSLLLFYLIYVFWLVYYYCFYNVLFFFCNFYNHFMI